MECEISFPPIFATRSNCERKSLDCTQENAFRRISNAWPKTLTFKEKCHPYLLVNSVRRSALDADGRVRPAGRVRGRAATARGRSAQAPAHRPRQGPRLRHGRRAAHQHWARVHPRRAPAGGRVPHAARDDQAHRGASGKGGPATVRAPNADLVMCSTCVCTCDLSAIDGLVSIRLYPVSNIGSDKGHSRNAIWERGSRDSRDMMRRPGLRWLCGSPACFGCRVWGLALNSKGFSPKLP